MINQRIQWKSNENLTNFSLWERKKAKSCQRHREMALASSQPSSQQKPGFICFFLYYHYRANNTNQAIIHDESTNQFNENQKKMEAKQKKNERSQPERGLAGVKSCVYGSLFCWPTAQTRCLVAASPHKSALLFLYCTTNASMGRPPLSAGPTKSNVMVVAAMIKKIYI